jgi:N-acetylglucosaminyldiphosphoundecaprenol N-acetyl-beta-D-mannosaminyltransferase
MQVYDQTADMNAGPDVFDPPAAGNGNPGNEKTLYFFGMRVDNTRCETALRTIDHFIAGNDGSGAREVFFTNVHSIQLGRSSREFQQCVNRADLVLPDGSGLALAGKLSGTRILENLNGTDFTPKVLARAEEHGWTVYLLGAEERIVERCKERLSVRYPRLTITGYHHGHFSAGENRAIIEEINRNAPDILLVALGSPYQEEWIARHARSLRVGVCMAVGGFFDFVSGVRPRAPRWMRRLGMEWLFRFVKDPLNKWERIVIEIPSFLILLLASRLMPKQLPTEKEFSS